MSKKAKKFKFVKKFHKMSKMVQLSGLGQTNNQPQWFFGLRTKTSQEQEQQELYPLYDHAASGW